MKTTRAPIVLVADDHEHMLRMVSMLLTSEGYQCVTARTGAQASALFKRENPAVVITDLRMPIGDGTTLIRTLRRSSRVPIIVLTGFGRGYADELQFLGDLVVLLKPFIPGTLLRLVRERCSPTWQARAATPALQGGEPIVA